MESAKHIVSNLNVDRTSMHPLAPSTPTCACRALQEFAGAVAVAALLVAVFLPALSETVVCAVGGLR